MAKVLLYTDLYSGYQYLNKELFQNALPDVIITLQRSLKYYGYFSPVRFFNKEDTEDMRSEIALNPEYFSVRTVEETFSTLVHEMCHLKAFIDKQHNNKGYHTKYWSSCMLSCDLMPSSTGKEGGKRTGYSMSHYIIPGGIYDVKIKSLLESGFGITWCDRYINGHIITQETVNQLLTENDARTESGKKYKYSCACSSVWGKKGLNIRCDTCGVTLDMCQ